MKTRTIALLLLALSNAAVYAKSSPTGEKYGSTLNLGLGLGYYGYVGHSVPVFHADYEFDVAKSFTLAPFIGFHSYKSNYYWGNSQYPNRRYGYRETVIPIGGKATYYFDRILGASSKWDFYLAGSLGLAIISQSWDDGYRGDKAEANGATPLYIDLHIGTECHITEKAGIFLDLSTGVSTIGVALHL
jgi:hypothetical protein